MKNIPTTYQRHTSFTPAWLSFEVNEALERISGPERKKKTTTVLQLAQAEADGRSQNQVFREHKRLGVCTKGAWQGRPERPGWKEDAEIAAALQVATARALWWVRVHEGQAVEKALNLLVNATDTTAGQLVRIATEGRASVIRGERGTFEEASVQDMIKAANSILDRVSEATAAKSAPGTQRIVLSWGDGGEDGGGAD